MTHEDKKIQGEKMGRRMIEGMEKRTKQLQAERALQQALLEDPNLECPEHIEQRHYAEQEKQKQVQEVERKAKQAKLQSEHLQNRYADQMTEINKLLVSLGGKPIIKAVKTTASIEVNTRSTTDTLSVDEEHYRTTLITNMIQLIHTKRKPV
jgi:pyruvate/2-oxoglutarate dehydrogenase complex dihydrolipoamide dehydrogenase (E3) component